MEGLYNYRIEKVVSIYDGDTMTVDIDLGFNISMKKQKLRLYGINTPEVRGEEKEEGIKVRDFVRNELVGAEIYIESHKDKSGKYGRWLATIWYKKNKEEYDFINLNELLVTMEYAKEYMK